MPVWIKKIVNTHFSSNRKLKWKTSKYLLLGTKYMSVSTSVGKFCIDFERDNTFTLKLDHSPIGRYTTLAIAKAEAELMMRTENTHAISV